MPLSTVTCDLTPEYVDCVEVCYNELEMEKANGQELEGLRVSNTPSVNLNKIKMINRCDWNCKVE